MKRERRAASSSRESTARASFLADAPPGQVTIADSIMGEVMSSSRCLPRLGFTRSRQPTS
jgi:hypothetical protein